MKSLNFIKYIFFLIGLAMLSAAVYWFIQTKSFTGRAIVTEGIVVDLHYSRSSDSHSYKPVVEFYTEDNRRIEFVSSSGSNPPGYRQGDKVEILYLPESPQEAEINDFFPLWGGITILGGIGIVFFLVGTGMIIGKKLISRRDRYLLIHGNPVDTKLQAIELNRRYSVNGRHPFVIISQWQNPATGKMHTFNSHSIWFDPADYIKNDRITVYIDRNNPKNYYMDISFLPELAE